MPPSFSRRLDSTAVFFKALNCPSGPLAPRGEPGHGATRICTELKKGCSVGLECRACYSLTSSRTQARHHCIQGVLQDNAGSRSGRLGEGATMTLFYYLELAICLSLSFRHTHAHLLKVWSSLIPIELLGLPASGGDVVRRLCYTTPLHFLHRPGCSASNTTVNGRAFHHHH